MLNHGRRMKMSNLPKNVEDQKDIIVAARLALAEVPTNHCYFIWRGERYHYGPVTDSTFQVSASTYVISPSRKLKAGEFVIYDENQELNSFLEERHSSRTVQTLEEMEREGLVVRTGEKRPGRNGLMEDVYELTSAGREAFGQLISK